LAALYVASFTRLVLFPLMEYLPGNPYKNICMASITAISLAVCPIPNLNE